MSSPAERIHRTNNVAATGADSPSGNRGRPTDQRIKAGSQPLIVQRSGDLAQQPALPVKPSGHGKPGPRRERSRSLQHVPASRQTGRSSKLSADSVARLPVLPPPRPKSPAPEFRRSGAGGQAKPVHVLQRRPSETLPRPGRGSAPDPSTRAPKQDEVAPGKQQRKPLPGKVDPTLPGRASSMPQRHFSSDTRYRIKRRSTPPQFAQSSVPEPEARSGRSRSNPTSPATTALLASGKKSTRTGHALARSRDSESESDSESLSSSGSSSNGGPNQDQQKSSSPPLSAYGQFQRYVTNANLMSGKAVGAQQCPSPPTDHPGAQDMETISLLAAQAPKRILHVMGLCERFVQLEHAKHCDPDTGKVHMAGSGPDFYSTVGLDNQEFDDFFHVHCSLRQYMHEQMSDSSLMKDFDRQLGALFARVKGLMRPPGSSIDRLSSADIDTLTTYADLEPYSRELVDAIHGARSRGTLAAPNWATSRLLPRTIFSLVKRLDGLYTILLLEDGAMDYDAINTAREKLIKYLLFDCTVNYLIHQQPNPFRNQGEDHTLYARLQQALEEHIQTVLEHGSGQFLQGLIRNTNTLGLGAALQDELTQRAQSAPPLSAARKAASPRTNFIARPRLAETSPGAPRVLRDQAWTAAFLAWLENDSLPEVMQQGLREVIQENRYNPDVPGIQSACVLPIHAYARHHKGEDAAVDQRLIQLIRRLRNETFEFQRIELDD